MRAPVRAFPQNAGMEAVHLLGGPRTVQVPNVCSFRVRLDTSFVEQAARILNISHIFVEEYDLLFLKRETAEVWQSMIRSDFSTKWEPQDTDVTCALGVTLRHFCVLDVMENIKGGSLSSKGFGVTPLDEVVLENLTQKVCYFSSVLQNAFRQHIDKVFHNRSLLKTSSSVNHRGTKGS